MPNEDPPSVAEIRDRTQQIFGIRPCLWQINVVQEVLRCKNDVISIAGTGMGKTLTFWMPLLFRPKGSVQVIVTPLNILGKQNVQSLEKAGMQSVFIGADSATPENFQAIENGEYQAVIITPEQMMKDGGGFEKIMRNRNFTQCLISVIFDEAHCISAWGSFRPEYREIGRLQYLLPRDIPRMVTSATLTPTVLADIKTTLQLCSERLTVFQKSNDRPNVHITVCPIMSSLSSFEDLKFLIADWKPGGSSPKKFLVFFDDISESIRACKALREFLPKEYHDKVVWFNSDMSNSFKDDETSRLMDGDSWGMFTTDSFGMGMDLPDILIVVQWRATCSLATLWQQFGRGARDLTKEATAVFLVEKEYFDEERKKKEERREKRKAKGSLALTASKKKRFLQGPPAPVDIASDLMELSDSDKSEHGDDIIPSDLDRLHARYQQLPELDKPKIKSSKRTLEPAVDDFINAQTRGFGCRRVPVHVSFENHKASSDHMQCNPALPAGCPRCHHPPSRLCCDLHSPSSFDNFVVPTRKVNRAPPRSRLNEYKMTTLDMKLYDALEDWREEKTIQVYGWAHFQNLGPTLIMPTDVLTRIVDCAHYFKISSKADLARETKWDEVENWGTEVVELILKILPLPAPPLPSPAPTTLRMLPIQGTGTVSAPLTASRKLVTCSRCGNTGHNARNRLCPRYLDSSTSGISSKENINTT